MTSSRPEGGHVTQGSCLSFVLPGQLATLLPALHLSSRLFAGGSKGSLWGLEAGVPGTGAPHPPAPNRRAPRPIPPPAPSPASCDQPPPRLCGPPRALPLATQGGPRPPVRGRSRRRPARRRAGLLRPDGARRPDRAGGRAEPGPRGCCGAIGPGCGRRHGERSQEGPGRGRVPGARARRGPAEGEGAAPPGVGASAGRLGRGLGGRCGGGGATWAGGAASGGGSVPGGRARGRGFFVRCAA